MNKIANANTILLLSVLLMIFIIPILPLNQQFYYYNSLFSLVLITSAFALQVKNKKVVLVTAFSLVAMEWILNRISYPFFLPVTRMLQGGFFIYIVVGLIRHTASSDVVTKRVIVDSISGYLLLGVLFTLFVFALYRSHPLAYHLPSQLGDQQDFTQRVSDMYYYTFITYTSTGYGDMYPVSPLAKSLSVLIATSGQLYLATIIAMLVGKVASTNKS